jgi:hypothetical protein
VFYTHSQLGNSKDSQELRALKPKEAVKVSLPVFAALRETISRSVEFRGACLEAKQYHLSHAPWRARV